MQRTVHAGGGTRRRRMGGRGVVWVTLASALAGAVSGCGSNSGIAEPVSTRVPASASASGTTPASSAPSGTQLVLSQYRGFWQTLTPASAAPEGQRRAMLAPYAADPELSSLLAGIARDRANGRVFYGTPVLRPQVTTVSAAARVAVVRDCQDATQTGDKDASSGRLLTKGGSRTLVVSTLHLLDDGRWHVVYVSFPKQQC